MVSETTDNGASVPYFNIANGVRQGGILSPRFAIYVDNLSDQLMKCNEGCYMDNQCINHVMYADDICIMALTPIALQAILDHCQEFGVTNDLI